MKLIELEVRNFLKLKTVFLEFNETGTLVIGGRNGQGKTSTIEAIAAALGGQMNKKDFPRPIRDGAERAEIVVKTDKFVVTRVITETGQRLEIKNPDGKKVDRPQELLNSFFSTVSFDIMSFCRQTPKQQVETLRVLLGLDFTKLDEDRKSLYDERTIINREHDRAKHHAESLPYHPDAPVAEMSVKELAEKLQSHSEAKGKNDAKRRELETFRKEYDYTRKALEQEEKDIRDLEARLAQLRESVKEREAQLAAMNDAGQKLKSEVDALADPDPKEVERVKAAMSDIENANQKMRDNARRAEAFEIAAQKAQDALKLTGKINDIDEEKRRLIASVNMPVEGLGFSDDGEYITFNNMPLSQASSAERLRVSCAMGFALNPECKLLLIRDGSLMDKDSMRMIEEMTEKHGGQVIIERVGNDDEVNVVIEDGEVQERRG